MDRAILCTVRLLICRWYDTVLNLNAQIECKKCIQSTQTMPLYVKKKCFYSTSNDATHTHTHTHTHTATVAKFPKELHTQEEDSYDKVEVFWAVTLCRVVVGHQTLRKTLLPPSSGWTENEGARSFERLVSYRNTTRCHNPEHLDLNLHRRKVKVKLSLYLIKHHALKTYWGSRSIAPSHDHFTPRERAPGTNWIGGWVGPRAVLGAAVKRKIPSPHRELNRKTPKRPARSLLSLHRMSYHKNTQLEISEKERENLGYVLFQIWEELFRAVPSSGCTRHHRENLKSRDASVSPDSYDSA
jgi:hypothetical protein